jgi:hypothetical protein
MQTEVYGHLASFKVEQGDNQKSQWELVVLISKQHSRPPITLSYSTAFRHLWQFSRPIKNSA